MAALPNTTGAHHSRRRVAAGFCLGLLLTAGVAAGDDEALPTGAEIMDRFVEVTGGGEAYAKLTNRERKGTMESGEAKMEFLIIEAPPRESYYAVNVDEMTMRRGTHNDISWVWRPRGGGQLVDGANRDRDLRDAFFYLPYRWREVFQEAQCEGIQKFEGEKCYKVKLVPSDGDPDYWYFSVETGLRRCMERIATAGMTTITLQLLDEDYREVDGIKFPHRVVRVRDGRRLGPVIFESIKHNIDLPPERFKPPTEVLQMLEKQQSGGAEPPASEAAGPGPMNDSELGDQPANVIRKEAIQGTTPVPEEKKPDAPSNAPPNENDNG